MMVVAFTGTRKGLTPGQKLAVTRQLQALRPDKVLHGDCLGADAEFHDIAYGLGLNIEIHPCTLHRQRANKFALRVHLPIDPLRRNRNMVNLADRVLACPGETDEQLRGSGTWATIRYARKINRQLEVIYP